MTKTITNIQAYKIALDTLKTLEDKWKVYVKEEVKQMSAFDEQRK